MSILKNASVDSQMAAMSSAAFSGWSGRLEMTYEGALDDDAGCLLFMVRFLFGEDEYLLSVKNGLSSDTRLKVRNVIGPDDFNPSFLKEHGVKLVGGTRRDAVFGGVVDVWAAEIKHSVLLRFSTRNRPRVHALVAMEAGRLREETINRFDASDGGHATDVSKGLVWAGSLRRKLLVSLPSTKRTPSRGGLGRFMGTVVVGSVVRMI